MTRLQLTALSKKPYFYFKQAHYVSAYHYLIWFYTVIKNLCFALLLSIGNRSALARGVQKNLENKEKNNTPSPLNVLVYAPSQDLTNEDESNTEAPLDRLKTSEIRNKPKQL